MKTNRTPAGQQDGTIRINRTVSYADRLRAYRVFVDGQFAGKIGAGKSLDLAVSPGEHTIVVKIDWCRSPRIQCKFNKGQTIKVECGSNLPGLRVFLNAFYILFRPHRYLTLQMV